MDMFTVRDLREWGLVALAMGLYRTGTVSLGKAVRISELSLEAFIEKLSKYGIPVVRYSAEELEQELAVLNKLWDKSE
ncbi:MAG: UPF0175 family protein [Alphaproteobacteria bacterium]